MFDVHERPLDSARRAVETGLAVALLSAVACSTSAQQTRQPSPTDVVATIGGGERITLAEVDERALQEPASSFGGAKLFQALYAARRSAIDEIVGDRLIDAEAKLRGIPRAKLVDEQINAKAPAPTDAEIEKWYKDNPARVQGASLDQVRAPIKSLLVQERTDVARANFIEQLKLKTPVTVTLEPPRVQMADGGHPARGPSSAAIEMIEFSDFQCPFCQRANPTVDQVLKTYGDRIRFVYRHFPLPNHPNARPAAEAAQCAEEQGKFWEYHDRLFANSSKLTDGDLKAHAAAIGLDSAKFNACFDGHQQKARVDADIAAGESAGVNGTPAFFINGRAIDGAQPYDVFQRVIDEELARKK
jgi:protein-disulfide isomerase